MEKRFIYADNAATTKIDSDVLAVMNEVMTSEYGNPSSMYSIGRRAKELLETARIDIANAIGAKYNEIYFTSGGSEADNWAIKGAAARMLKKGKKHIISTEFEHHAVLHTLDALKRQGFSVTLLPVYENGIIKIDDLKNAITEDTGLVTIMYANNEIGTIQPIKEVGEICREKGIVFHTDAVQALSNIKLDVVRDNIDLMSMSAHKVHGPKGVGALYIRKGVVIENLLDGGAQERSRRAGTENVAGAVGFAAAVKKAEENLENHTKHLTNLRDRFIAGASKIVRSRVNGDLNNRLAGNVNMCFEGIEGESMLLLLDMAGVCASSGSACTSGSLDPSHVLLAIGLPHEIAHGSLRLSFSMENTEEDVDYILEKLPPIIDRLREMSPLWERIMKEQEA